MCLWVRGCVHERPFGEWGVAGKIGTDCKLRAQKLRAYQERGVHTESGARTGVCAHCPMCVQYALVTLSK